jgi:aryl-alcohol dehydrogenase-like predicted oxidoreductase
MAPITLRELGKTGVKVPAIGLGCMGMSEFYGPADEAENIKVLETAIKKGCTFWDTADMYGVGKNEELIAKVLKTQRSNVFICTKFGIVRGPNGEFVKQSGKPEYVREACEKSLKRLGIDTIDLYYQHRVDPETPIEETVRAMAELVKEGKVRYLGLSECSADTLRRAHAVHPIAALQIEFSPWTLDIERNGILGTARELGITIVAYSPLGRGMLTGAFKSHDDLADGDFRKTNPRFSRENFPKNIELVEKFKRIAEKKQVTTSQVVLAWVLAQGQDFIVIPGTKKIKYLEENIAANDVELTEAELKEIREAIASCQVFGDRYDSHSMKALDSNL